MAQRKAGSPEDALSKFTTYSGSLLALLMFEKQRMLSWMSGKRKRWRGAFWLVASSILAVMWD
jgi:hypothetical protein